MWTRLIRFVDKNGEENFGDATDSSLKQARVVTGSVFDESSVAVAGELQS